MWLTPGPHGTQEGCKGRDFPCHMTYELGWCLREYNHLTTMTLRTDWRIRLRLSKLRRGLSSAKEIVVDAHASDTGHADGVLTNTNAEILKMSAIDSWENTTKCSSSFALSESSSGAPSTVSESRFFTCFILHPTVALAWPLRHLSSCFCLYCNSRSKGWEDRNEVSQWSISLFRCISPLTYLCSLTASNTEQSWISVVLRKLRYLYLLADIRWFLALAWTISNT